MKKFCYLIALSCSIAHGQTNSYPASGNVKIFAVGESWAEGIAIVRPSGWSGLRLTRNDPSGNNYNGNWALGYSGNTGNDFSISTNYNGTQYDGLFHISNSTRNVGIGTTSPNSALAVRGRVGIRADADPSTPTETMRVEGAFTSEENVMNVTNMADQDFLVRLSAVGASVKRTIIGPSVSSRFSLGLGVSAGNEYLTLVNGGNVGIGTTVPNAKLDLGNGYGSNGVKLLIYNDNSSSELAGTKCGFYMDNFRPNNLNLVFPEASANPGLFTISAKNTSGTTLNPYFSVSGLTGNVGIGTTSPNQKLTVNGTIYGKEVKIDLGVPGPDYVFEKDYELPSLNQVQSYIEENKHLPEVPSAAEMEKNGINLGEMNMLLLKKVEELTLYLIEQNKLISKQNDRIVALENKK